MSSEAGVFFSLTAVASRLFILLTVDAACAVFLERKKTKDAIMHSRFPGMFVIALSICV